MLPVVRLKSIAGARLEFVVAPIKCVLTISSGEPTGVVVLVGRKTVDLEDFLHDGPVAPAVD